MRYLAAMIVALVLGLSSAGGVAAQTCSGATWCGVYDGETRTCDCANQLLARHNCEPSASSCGEYNCEDDKNACWCAATCGWTGGGGGGGGSCPGECRQGSACGVGYSGASGCSGSGPGGGCKSNQVCCSANSCGGGGGGGSVACVQPVNCPPGTVKSATVTSSVCQELCGSNAWGTGGSPGSAQSMGECCRYEETGGGNCVWEPCPTKNNPNKVCKVCDPVETWCKRDSVVTYECIPSCSAQNPSTPSLVSPANGASIGGGGVTLDWSAIASWGVACDPAYQYEVIVDTDPTPTTIYSVVDDSVTADYYSGTVGQTYYWKIRAHNGSVYTDSAVRSFTLVDNQITGTVYIDPAGTCSQATPGNMGGALGLSWEDDTVTVGANGQFTLTATVGGSGTLALTGIPAGYICSPGCGTGTCSETGVDPAVNGVGHNFYVTPSRGAWFQLEGAGVYAGSTGGGVTVSSLVPSGQDFILPGALGSVGALMRASGSYDVESQGGELSSTGWNAISRYKGKTLDYGYFASREGVAPTKTNDWTSDTLTQKTDDGRDFWFINPAGNATISSAWNVAGGDSLVVFVDGNLDINNNITVANGSFLAFIVSGNITIDKSVTQVQGLYVTDGTLTTSSGAPVADVALTVQGSMVAWGGVQLNRDLIAGNITTPAEKFVYRPDLIVNMPAKMRTYALEWTEVAPGTYGE